MQRATERNDGVEHTRKRERHELLRRGLLLEYVTLGWNVVGVLSRVHRHLDRLRHLLGQAVRVNDVAFEPTDRSEASA